MRTFTLILLLTCLYSCSSGKDRTFIASTPAHIDVREFLGISLTDSIDFIRWKLVFNDINYTLNCEYGIGKPNTNGFIDEKRVNFSGKVNRNGNYYALQQGNRTMWMFEINNNLIHLLDKNKAMLIGNGGWSFTLNNTAPVKTDVFNIPTKKIHPEPFMVFEGRTPCKDASSTYSLRNDASCYKLKWLFLFYSDPKTGKPTYFLTGGMGYKKETMDKGTWEIIQGQDGRLIYKLYHEKRQIHLYLLKAGETILVFTDPEGNLLVGNDDFSYTLNRTQRKML